MRAVALGLVLLVAGVAVVGSGYLKSADSDPSSEQPVELESALLPPIGFRRWIASVADDKYAEKNELKLDRFAGRGRGSKHPTEMPGYFEKEMKEAKSEYNDVLEDLRKVEEQLAEDPGNEELKEDKAELEAKLVEARKGWDEVQIKINKMNREMVHGKQSSWDQNGEMGVSDQYVPAKQAHLQQWGLGYGKKNSLVDWLEGDR